MVFTMYLDLMVKSNTLIIMQTDKMWVPGSIMRMANHDSFIFKILRILMFTKHIVIHKVKKMNARAKL